jgi:hypothetical protein
MLSLKRNLFSISLTPQGMIFKQRDYCCHNGKERGNPTLNNHLHAIFSKRKSDYDVETVEDRRKLSKKHKEETMTALSTGDVTSGLKRPRQTSRHSMALSRQRITRRLQTSEACNAEDNFAVPW